MIATMAGYGPDALRARVPAGTGLYARSLSTIIAVSGGYGIPGVALIEAHNDGPGVGKLEITAQQQIRYAAPGDGYGVGLDVELAAQMTHSFGGVVLRSATEEMGWVRVGVYSAHTPQQGFRANGRVFMQDRYGERRQGAWAASSGTPGVGGVDREIQALVQFTMLWTMGLVNFSGVVLNDVKLWIGEDEQGGLEIAPAPGDYSAPTDEAGAIVLGRIGQGPAHERIVYVRRSVTTAANGEVVRPRARTVLEASWIGL